MKVLGLTRCCAALVLSLACAVVPGVASAAKQTRSASHAGAAKAQSAAALANQAARALFEKSDLDGARALADAALHARKPGEEAILEALFVKMEAGALQVDTAAELDSALRLCELRANTDARVTVAAARVLDRAANTTGFRAIVPRLEKLVAAGGPQTTYLRAALLAAAADGVPGLSVTDLARQSGLITDWRIVGPFGRYPNVAFERAWAPEQDGLSQSAYESHAVENFRFEDGNLALPDYFSPSGIFYAAAQVNITEPGEWRIRVESTGTLQIFVDGTDALTRDDRFAEQPEVVWRALNLSQGAHNILLKMLPSAAPLRVAFLPPAVTPHHAKTARAGNPAAEQRATRTEITNEAEAQYVRAAESYWAGDYASALGVLKQAPKSAATDFLLAQTLAHSTADATQELGLLKQTLATAPQAFAAEYQLAARAYANNDIEEALRCVQRVVAAHPEFAPGQHLLAQAAVHLNLTAEAARAVAADIRLHPSCETLRSGMKFFSGMEAFKHATQIETQLDGCAPGSLAYAQALKEAGRHLESAAAAGRIVAERPLDREARALQVTELAFAGKTDAAKQAAEQLVKLAPNAVRFRQVAQNAALRVPDDPGERGRELLSDHPFYSHYRRDGLHIFQLTAKRRFAGGPAVILLNDAVTRVAEDGSVSVYAHRITRVLDRGGIEKYGEVTLPRNADLLELRTIKADGTMAEPEFSQHKASISMPALAPGDAIEQEYVVHYPDFASAQRAGAMHFTFGSFAAPILYTRYAVLWPANAKVALVESAGGLPKSVTHAKGGTMVRMWEKENIWQSVEEASAPPVDLLPTVRIAARDRGWDELRDFYRDKLIFALRPGMRAQETAARILATVQDNTAATAPGGKANQEEIARAIYHWVTTKVRRDDSSFAGGEVASVESTLSDFSGSRTAALIGLARAVGIQADLLLARDVTKERTPDSYTRPLVVFRVSEPNGGTKQLLADAERDGVGLGALPPSIARTDALLVPWRPEEVKTATAFIKLPAVASDEQSTADGDVWLDAQGNLSAVLTIRMGSSRGAQMRWILSGIDPGERKHFFEQLAMRIFPGASEATGAVRNELNPDQSLEILLNCRAPHFANFAAGIADMDQLVPALGLRKMYLGADPRRFPLYVDTPLVEKASFRVRLPEGIGVKYKAADVRLRSEFGSYSVEFRQAAPNEIEIRRTFEIPVQMVPPERFSGFSRFARQIDEAERQRLVIGNL
ncbi:MAG: DUF3857 domain-containing protein [Terriglobales bacterium]